MALIKNPLFTLIVLVAALCVEQGLFDGYLSTVPFMETEK